MAAALVTEYGVATYARRGEDDRTYYRHIGAAIDHAPQITMDDGADVIGVLHGERREMLDGVIGGTEDTTTGVIRLRALEAEGRLGFPVVSVNDADTKHLFDNRYGTGQSTSTASCAPPTSSSRAAARSSWPGSAGAGAALPGGCAGWART